MPFINLPFIAPPDFDPMAPENFENLPFSPPPGFDPFSPENIQLLGSDKDAGGNDPIMDLIMRMLGGGQEQPQPEDPRISKARNGILDAIMQQVGQLGQEGEQFQFQGPTRAQTIMRGLADGIGAGLTVDARTGQDASPIIAQREAINQAEFNRQLQEFQVNQRGQGQNNLGALANVLQTLTPRQQGGSGLEGRLLTELFGRQREARTEAREAERARRGFAETQAAKYPMAGIDIEGDDRAAVLKKIEPFAIADRKRTFDAAESLLIARDDIREDRDSRRRNVETEVTRGGGVIREARNVADALGRLGLNDEAEALGDQALTVAETIEVAREDPTGANAGSLRSEVAALRRAKEKAFAKTQKANKLLTEDAIGDFRRLLQLERDIKAAQELVTAGGPIQGLPLVNLLGGEDFREYERLLSNISRFGAFTDGGKALTGIEEAIIRPSQIVSGRDTTTTARVKLRGLLQTTEEALRGAMRNTGLTREQLEYATGISEDSLIDAIQVP